jgi:hypothetical protein
MSGTRQANRSTSPANRNKPMPATVINLPSATIYCTADQLATVLGQLKEASVVNMPHVKIVVVRSVPVHEDTA